MTTADPLDFGAPLVRTIPALPAVEPLPVPGATPEAWPEVTAMRGPWFEVAELDDDGAQAIGSALRASVTEAEADRGAAVTLDPGGVEYFGILQHDYAFSCDRPGQDCLHVDPEDALRHANRPMVQQ